MSDSFDILKELRRNHSYKKTEKEGTSVLPLSSEINIVQEKSQIEEINNVDLIPYAEEIKKKIKENWDPPYFGKSYKIIALFKISSKGKLFSIKLEKSSGYRTIDDIAVNTIKASAPFNPFPQGSKNKSIAIQFTFSYNSQSQENKIKAPQNIEPSKVIESKSTQIREEESSISHSAKFDYFSVILVGIFFIFGAWYFLYSLLLTFMTANYASAVTNIITGIILSSIFWETKNKHLKAQYSKLESNNLSVKNNLEVYKSYSEKLKMQNEFLANNISAGMDYLSEFIADMKTLNYELSEAMLKNKKRPAIVEAQRIASLRKETREYIKEYKLMRYEYEYLFTIFPELENYIDFYGQDNNVSLEEVKDNYDYVKKWISNEDYEKLNENQRNQLALDNYVSSKKKNKWQIGRDYEMFIGHEYEKQGYKVEYTGIVKRIEDLGRDLIVKNDTEILIVQCKNWSKHKVIHENHICQLFGTVIQYNIENNQKAIPVFITTTVLSETAMKFAEYLGIKVLQEKKFEDFPRIKCNINSKEKIYHLPFDQQYDKTIIDSKNGEFFAWTVQEAVDNGFRRAKKYFFSN